MVTCSSPLRDFDLHPGCSVENAAAIMPTPAQGGERGGCRQKSRSPRPSGWGGLGKRVTANSTSGKCRECLVQETTELRAAGAGSMRSRAHGN